VNTTFVGELQKTKATCDTNTLYGTLHTFHILQRIYSWELTSWLLQGMRDAIFSGSWLVWILSTACVYYVSRKYWSRQLV
jgi:hypothetical protein